MKDFFEKEDYIEEDITNLINNKIEESLNLEFKSSGSLINNDKNKNEISKDVSAFANSNGGIIIYGIEEENHVASKLSFIDGNLIKKEWLEQIINTRVIRKIVNIKIIPIRFDKDIKKSIYIVKIPESDDAPHMAYGNKYYRRQNFEVKPMEEFEVRNAYIKKKKSILSITIPKVQKINSLYKSLIFNFGIHIHNSGNTIEEHFKLELLIPKELFSKIGYKSDFIEDVAIESPLLQFLTHEDKEFYRFLIPNKEVIFQNEELKIIDCFLTVTEENLDKKIMMKLYFSSGIETRERTVAELIRDFELHQVVLKYINEYKQKGNISQNKD